MVAKAPGEAGARTAPWFLVGNEGIKAPKKPFEGVCGYLIPPFPTKNQPDYLEVQGTYKPIKSVVIAHLQCPLRILIGL